MNLDLLSFFAGWNCSPWRNGWGSRGLSEQYDEAEWAFVLRICCCAGRTDRSGSITCTRCSTGCGIETPIILHPSSVILGGRLALNAYSCIKSVRPVSYNALHSNTSGLSPKLEVPVQISSA